MAASLSEGNALRVVRFASADVHQASFPPVKPSLFSSLTACYAPALGQFSIQLSAFANTPESFVLLRVPALFCTFFHVIAISSSYYMVITDSCSLAKNSRPFAERTLIAKSYCVGGERIVLPFVQGVFYVCCRIFLSTQGNYRGTCVQLSAGKLKTVHQLCTFTLVSSVYCVPYFDK